MNNIKRITALLMTFALAFSIASCGKEETSPPVNTTTTTSAGTTENSSTVSLETTVSKVSEKPTTQTKNTSKAVPVILEKSLTSSDKDKQKLKSLLTYVIGYSDNLSSYIDYFFGDREGEIDKKPGNTVYDSLSENSLENAFKTMTQLSYVNLCQVVCSDYGWDNGIDYPDSETPDPKNKMSAKYLHGADDDSNYYYCKISSKYVDRVLTEVMNVKPDHSYIFENKEGNESYFEKTVAYYYDGYYYFSCPDGGDGGGPRVIIDKMSLNNDGIYDVTVTLQYGAGEEFETLCQCNVTCGLYDNTETRLWKLYRITEK